MAAICKECKNAFYPEKDQGVVCENDDTYCNICAVKLNISECATCECVAKIDCIVTAIGRKGLKEGKCCEECSANYNIGTCSECGTKTAIETRSYCVNCA